MSIHFSSPLRIKINCISTAKYAIILQQSAVEKNQSSLVVVTIYNAT
jgi:hypothetical protein